MTAELATLTDIESWRTAEFRALGFSHEDARALARTLGPDGWPLSLDAVRRAIRGGCPVDVAVRIFL